MKRTVYFSHDESIYRLSISKNGVERLMVLEDDVWWYVTGLKKFVVMSYDRKEFEKLRDLISNMVAILSNKMDSLVTIKVSK